MQISSDLGIGAILLAIAFALIWLGLPNKNGESPRFLRFEQSIVLYPPLVLVFFATGLAAIISGLLANSQQ